ncbi:hypothetical protein LIER_04335 [Lithospermum erythrorhizon]|uniref:Uncharacterized protein n=1 Tax=Lithospermum erythrorhizon TaxID=34254 RepID=A0AAV3NWE4_LITER
MVKTRKGLNMSGKATKGKKKGVGFSDDACMEVKAPILNQEAQKIKGQKLTVKGVLHNVIGEEVVPIFEERVIESSVADMSEATDALDPSVNPSVEDTTEHVTAKSADEGVLPSVTGTEAETAGNMERPSIGQGFDDTLDDDIHEVIPEDVDPKKKSKKRKHKKSVDAGESFEPKRKLSKEERKAKRARKAKRRARRTAQEDVDVNNDVPEEAEETVPEEVRPSVVQPDTDDEWLPEHEPQGNNADEEAQEFKE